jgi:DHA1 family tetracycline resistance protein-like MFS transporter
MFILGTVLLDVLALGMIIPVLPKIVIGMVGGDSHQAAKIFGLFGFSWALMQFLFSPILGALSDRFGRRPIILFSNFALGLNYILMALAPDLISLFMTRLFSGIAAASITTAGAYIADVTKAEDRSAAFGKIGMAFSFAFILGPAVSGLLGADDPRFPFWVAAGLSLLNGLYGWFVLPESLALSQRAPFRWRNAHALGAFKFLRQHPALLGLAAIFFLNSLAHEVMPATFVLYADYRYHWDIRTISLALAVFGIFGAVVQGLFIKPFVRRFGERRAMVAGLAFGVLGFGLYGAAPDGYWFCAAIPFAALWGLANAAMQGVLTTKVGADSQGQLQGALGALRSLGGLAGPFLFTGVFAWAISGAEIDHVPGAAFYLSSLLLLAAGVLTLKLLWGAGATADN